MNDFGAFLNKIKEKPDAFNNIMGNPNRSNKIQTKTRDEMITDFNQLREQCMRLMMDSGMVTIPTTTNKKAKKHRKKKNRKTIAELHPIFIKELTKCDTYFDRRLVCRIIVKPYKMTAIHMIVEDDFESVLPLSIYGDSNRKKYTIGAKLCVDEPYYKLAQDMSYRIRVDDPSKVKILSNKIPIGVNEKSAKNWKDLANKCFTNKQYKTANLCYSYGINQTCNGNNNVATALLNNLSACYIAQRKYKQAYVNIIASKYINSNVFKIWHREISCLSQLNYDKTALFVWKEAGKTFPKYKHMLLELEKKLKLKTKAKQSDCDAINTEWDVLGIIVADKNEKNIKSKTRKFTAIQFKQRGNDEFGKKNYEAAIQYYSDGLVKHYDILSVLYSNRAASFIHLREYKNAFLDSTISVVINANNIKGWYRRCITSFKLNSNEIGNAIYKQYFNKNKLFTKLFNSHQKGFVYKECIKSNVSLNSDVVYETDDCKISKEKVINVFRHRNRSNPTMRIHHVLRLYESWIDSRSKCKFSFGTFLKSNLNYTHHAILDDFHKKSIDDATNYHYSCKLANCHFVDRNNGDRSKEIKRRQIYFDYDDSINCSLFQTLDSIHSAVCHNDVHRNKLSDKFVMNFEIQDNEQDDNKNDSVNVYNNFGFGEPFVYYDQFSATGLFIEAYYDTLEEELLNNPYYKFTKQEYEDLYIKASTLLKTELFSKTITAKIGGNAEKLGIKEGETMSIDHIISLLVYCNETEAQKIFKEQCRKVYANESDRDIKKKHGYIANWMTCLWDATRIFGTLLHENDVIYTGMSCKLLFSSFLNFYYAPLSTSTSNIVARNFASIDGIVVKLKAGGAIPRYFDMIPLSNYPNEKERFLLSAKLNIVDIIIDRSYFVEVCALRLFEKIISGALFYNDCNAELLTNDVQFINNYLQNKKYAENCNLNYMQCMLNNMISNYLNPENYDARKMQRFDEDTFHIFVDNEEIQKLNSKLSQYFWTQGNYGCLFEKFNRENKRMINFCCKHTTLKFNRKEIVQLKNEKQIETMRYCYTTEPFKMYTNNGTGEFFTFTLRFCKASLDDSDRYEIFLRDLTKRHHTILISYDLFCKEIKYQMLRFQTVLSYGSDVGFVAFLCSRLNDVVSKLHIILNMRIFEM